jgi:hypothetical protein
LEATARNVGLDQPVSVRLEAALASEKHNLEVNASVDPRELSQVRGRLSLKRARIQELSALLPAGLGEEITGGWVELDAQLAPGQHRTIIASGRAQVDALRLHGEPADGGFEFSGRFAPHDPSLSRFEVKDLKLKGAGIDLGGTASLQAQPRRVEFAVAGPLLDLETVLGPPQKGPERREKQEKQEKRGNQVVLPEGLRNQVADVEADGTIKVDRLVNGRLEVRGLQAHAVLRNGQLELETARARLWQGTVDASGTRLNLNAARPEWNLRATLQGIDMGKAMAEISDEAPPLQGQVDSNLTVVGRGSSWEEVAPTVSGRGTVTLKGGVLTSVDLGGRVASGLAQGLHMVGMFGEAKEDGSAKGRTPLGNVTTSFTVRNGWLDLENPLSINSPFGAVNLKGRIGLSQQLDLHGRVSLSPPFLSKTLGAFRLHPRVAVGVPVAVGGTLDQPTVTLLKSKESASEVQEKGGQRRGRRRLIPLPR